MNRNEPCCDLGAVSGAYGNAHMYKCFFQQQFSKL